MEKEKRPALITFTVAGDNAKKFIKNIKFNCKECRYSRAFIYTIPYCRWSQIQNSTYRSLSNGTTLKDTFQIAKKFKNKNPKKPLILMGYYNLIYQNVNNF